MTFSSKMINAASIVAFTAMTLVAGAASAAEAGTWTGRVVDPTGKIPGHSTHFKLQIDDTTSDAEARELMALLEQDEEQFEDRLEDLDRGYIQIGSGLAQDIAIARVIDNGDGSQTVRVVLDRPMAMGEHIHNTRSTDYPYSVLQFEVDAEGKGEGKMVMAADLGADDGELEIKNLSRRPFELMNIQTR